MATITPKQIHRNRIQFSMNQQLFDAHQANVKMAKELNTIIDFTRDFERWFGQQVEQVSKALLQMKEENSAPQTEFAAACVSSTIAVASHSETASVTNDEASTAHKMEAHDGRD